MNLRPALALVPLAWAALGAALGAAPGAAQAENRSEVLLDLLGRVPAELIHPAPGAWAEPHFADHQAAAATLPPGADGAAGEGSYGRIGMAVLDVALGAGLDGAWEPLVGFGPMDVEAHLSLGSGAGGSMLLHLDPAAAARVAPALLASGYREEARDGVAALARGEDGLMDLEGLNPADPFGAGMGMASRVVVDGSLVVQSSTWGGLLALAGAQGHRGHPDLGPMAAVIDRPGWGNVALVEAVLLPHQLDLGTGGGLPPWRLGLLADLSPSAEAAAAGTGSVTLVMVSFFGRAEAERAAARIADGWDETLATLGPLDFPLEEAMPAPGTVPALLTAPSLAEVVGAEVETGVAGNGPFVAWTALRTPAVPPSLGVPRNDGFRLLWRAIYTRELTLFGPP